LRQSIYSRLQVMKTSTTPGAISQGPAFRLTGSEKIRHRGAALPPRLHRFETGVPTQAANLRGMIG
jgi:hypothetical protein